MKKIIIFSLIILFFPKTQNVFGATGVFTVDNIEVIGELDGNNNRDKYLRVAFKKGFQKLITGIIRKKDQKELLSTDLKKISTFVSSYKILEEKVSDNKYNLKLGITFNRKSVERFLQNKNVSYSQVKKLNILIYPILIKESNLQIFSKNKFFEQWNEKEENDLDNINFILPVENLDDIDYIKNNLDNIEESNLSRLVDNYEIKNSSILILRYDEKKLNVFLKTNLSGFKKVKKIDFELENLDNKEVVNDIILNLKYYINELWKEENLIDISAPSYLTLNSKIKDSNSLTETIEKIKKISLIESYTIEELDNKSVKIKIKFFGKIRVLQERFNENGFQFKISNDEWNLYLNT
tara:strand:- start:15549 stop:16604 length:1056 start_codon:yes stop_codon:yes gene_type:complete